MAQSTEYSKTIRIELPPDEETDGLEEQDVRTQDGTTCETVVSDIAIPSLSSLFETVYDSALLTDSNGTILDANNRATQLFGIEKNELHGHSVLDLIAGATPELLDEICENLAEDRFTLIQAICHRNGQSSFPAEITASILHSDGTHYVAFFFRDISKRKQTEAHRAQLNSILLTLSRVGELIADQDASDSPALAVCNNLVESGRYASVWVGLLDESGAITTTIGAGVDTLDLLEEKNQSGWQPSCISKALETHNVITMRSTSAECRDCPACCTDSERASLVVQLESQGDVYGVVAANAPLSFVDDEREIILFREIANALAFALREQEAQVKRRESDAALQAEHDQLEVRVETRTRQLARTNMDLLDEISERKQAEERLRWAVSRLEEHNLAKTQFVSNVSHELGTPLASIKYVIGNMLQGLAGEMSPKAESYLSMMKQDCNRLIDTVNEILDLTRLESGSLGLDRAVLPFKALVRHAVQSLRIQAEMSDIALQMSLPQHELFVDGDVRKLERVVINIVKNAIKYTPAGGSVTVELSPKDDSSKVVFRTKDTGIGIAAEDLPNVTKRYFRVGEHVSGTGLGLSISKDLIELHEGTLHIDSPVSGTDQGTEVTIRLPGRSPLKAMILSDDMDAGSLLKDRIQTAGYHATGSTSHSASDILNDVAGQEPDLVLAYWSSESPDIGAAVAAIAATVDTTCVPILGVVPKDVSTSKSQIMDGIGMTPVIMTDTAIPIPLEEAIEEAILLKRGLTDHKR